MNSDRFALTIDEYLAEKDVMFYLEDAITQLLEHKEEYVQFGVSRYLAEYFNSVRHGSHVLFREFGYIKATPHNRASFIRIFWKCYRQIGKNGVLLSTLEYSSLLQLICPDFPVEVAQDNYRSRRTETPSIRQRMVLLDDALDCPMTFADFLHALQIQLYFEEFIESITVIYQDLLSGKSPNTVIVPTSTSVEQLPPLATSETAAQEGVDASAFQDAVEAACERYKHSHPPAPAVGEILQQDERVTLYGFLTALAKHEGISKAIGSLPSRADLLIDPEMDQELERLIAQISVSPTSSSSQAAAQRDSGRKASPRKSLHHRKRIEMESDGSTEETDSSEN